MLPQRGISLSSWITLNISSDYPEEIREYLEDSEINFGFMPENKLDEHEGIDLIAYVFTSGGKNPVSKEYYLDLLRDRKSLIESIYLVDASDTSDEGQLIEYVKVSGSFKEGTSWNGRLRLKLGAPSHFICGDKLVLEDLKERKNVRPSLGGNYS